MILENYGDTYLQEEYSKDHDISCIQEPSSIISRSNVISQIGDSSFPVFKISLNGTDRLYALKVFPYDGNKPSKWFLNEIRFTNLSHPNIVSPLYFEQEQSFPIDSKTSSVSCILSDFVSGREMIKMFEVDNVRFDETLVRTYFHQLINAVEYLHSVGIYHLDIKIDNLLIDDDLELKLIDFDLSSKSNDIDILSNGTNHYRCPEIAERNCSDPSAADIYSCGIVLFVFKSGILPYCENGTTNGINFLKLLENETSTFWDHHAKLQNQSSNFWEDDFKELFYGMTRKDPKQRYTLADIKNSPWFNGPIYQKEEIYQILKNFY